MLIVGGPDVDLRLDLMGALREEFSLAAAGSEAGLGERLSRAGFPYFHYPLERGRNPLADLRSVVALRAILRSYRPDIVHTFDTKPCVWGRIAARWAGVPVVVGTIPGLGSLYASDGLRTRAVRALYQRLQKAACAVADLTIFQNARDARQFVAAGVSAPDKTALIPGSGVRTEHFDARAVGADAVREVRERIGAGPDTAVVTLIARLVRTKGVLDFARAAALVRERREDVVFLLVGPEDPGGGDGLGPEEIREVLDSVVWIGAQDDVRPSLAASDVFVFPSYYREGVPRVLLEAASMGLPLVTTRTPGCEDVVEEGVNGELVEPRDPRALAAVIERLLADPEWRAELGHASRRIARQRFDLSIVARETARHYRRLLPDRGVRS